MPAILDHHGNPIRPADLTEPQTARIAALQHQLVESQLDGLTPARAARTLRDADQGDITAQHRLFDDMIDRDAHLRCEFGKRQGAVVGLDWSVEPPPNATSAEENAAAWAEDVLRTAVDDFSDTLQALMEGVGHGFSPVELEWALVDGYRLPTFHARPQTWFRLDTTRRHLRLADGSGDGAPLQPFGWIVHQPGKIKTGYLGRAGLFRAVLWPFLYKAYSVGDFAEFLEVYGLPLIVGKYLPGATDDEKASLLRAVASLGRDARAIMPDGMEIEINKIAAGAGDTAHLAMVAWADGAQSKAVLGQVLSAEAKSTGMGSGVADLHAEVRRDILAADARQLANTLTRDLIYPMLALNLPGSVSRPTRCPRLVFDLGEAEDLKLYAEALPALAAGGARIPVAWVHEKLRIPVAAEGEAVFGAPAAPPPGPSGDGKPAGNADQAQAAGAGEAAAKYDASMINAYSMGIDRFARLGMAIPETFIRDVFSIPVPRAGEKLLTPVQPAATGEASPTGAAALAALSADLATPPAPTPETLLADRLAREAAPAVADLLDTIQTLLNQAGSLEELRELLLAAYPDLPRGGLAALMGQAFQAATLAGLMAVRDEADFRG